jgi:protein-tyrosine phosphatase
MIDLHCHILPGIDDGALDLETALAMARIAVEDGIITVACTPHIMPGVYRNDSGSITKAIDALTGALAEAEIPLELTIGADVHVEPNLLNRLRSGEVPTIGGSRYFLFEPPHHILPPRLHDFAFELVAAGYVPIMTHPERLTWIDANFGLIRSLAESGVMMQLTAGSFLGHFGRSAHYWAERMLDEGLVDLLATDAHDTRRRRPNLSKARDWVAHKLNDEIATRLVATNPLYILKNVVLKERGVLEAVSE